MNQEIPNDQRTEMSELPVILCHVACSGGSLIYRTILSSFNCLGVSEIGHGRRPNAKRFAAVDPEMQLYSRGEMSHQEFGEILIERVQATQRLATERKQRLLLREHTHSYFFDKDEEFAFPDSASWIAGEYRSRLNQTLPLIVTVRNPIDSWLGFRSSFPNQALASFDKYCQIYNEFLDRVEAWENQGNPIFRFRYEELVTDKVQTLVKLGTFLGQEYKGTDDQLAKKVVSSGNSGRQAAEPEKRTRRPFTTKLIKNAKTSQAYQRLTERLGYPPIFQGITSIDYAKAGMNQVVAQIFGVTNSIEPSARWLYEKLKGGRNIQ